MMIWINGAFGAGKTQTAYELHYRLPGSIVFDPENAGFYIRRNLPSTLAKDDFQDYAMWRQINTEMLSYITQHFDGIVIIPMTVVHPQYFDELIGEPRRKGIALHHFVLGASRETLLGRLRSRGDGSKSWPAQQIDRCVAALSDPLFATWLDTEKWTVSETAERIAQLAGVELQPDNRSALRKRLDRWKVKFQHIRF
ncbi:AAA family ATPase [Paenibacillus sp. GCM10027626]|uniref:AAA family ATPase n=1 Tax=Paenibacillus sp. GCM10027626 TaxID=3273411 RepID=UPI003639E84E